jgi:hypothetical protein
MKYHLIKKKKNINILSNRSGIDLFSLDACGIFSFEISRRGEVFCFLHCILKVFLKNLNFLFFYFKLIFF